MRYEFAVTDFKKKIMKTNLKITIMIIVINNYCGQLIRII